MTRPLRIDIAGAVHHVTARGNDKQVVFEDERDYRSFLALLSETVERYGWHCLTYCLMPNHYHLIVRTPQPNLSRGMQYLNGRYAQRFNHRHVRVGHVWQSRFGARLIQDDGYLMNAVRYVVFNPVRSELVARPADWRWSSHAAVLGHTRPLVVDVDALLGYLGGSPETARVLYAEITEAGGLDPATEHGASLGSADFARESVRDVTRHSEISRREWGPGRPPLEAILLGDDRGDEIRRAHRLHGYTLKEIADLLGCHYSTVSRWMHAADAA